MRRPRIERKTDAERATELRQAAQTIRRGGLGRIGERQARLAEKKAAKLERGK
jgi:hypothetical protein